MLTIMDFIIAGFFLLCILIMVIGAIITAIKYPTPKIKDNPKLTRREIYNNYMHSQAWRDRRQRALILANFKCERCGSKENLHVHHLTYMHFGNELDSELKVLCRPCHNWVHGRKF